MKEAAVVRAVQRVLTQRGAWWINVHRSGAGRNGIPDILACYHGRFLGLEIKSPTGRPSPLQQHELRQIAAAGGGAHIVRSAQHAAAILDAIDKDTP